MKTIRSVHALIMAGDPGSGAVTLDCSGVTGCDAAGVQLLASTFRSFAASRRELRISAPPQAMSQSLARAGLALSPAGDALLSSGN